MHFLSFAYLYCFSLSYLLFISLFEYHLPPYSPFSASVLRLLLLHVCFFYIFLLYIYFSVRFLFFFIYYNFFLLLSSFLNFFFYTFYSFFFYLLYLWYVSSFFFISTAFSFPLFSYYHLRYCPSISLRAGISFYSYHVSVFVLFFFVLHFFFIFFSHASIFTLLSSPVLYFFPRLICFFLELFMNSHEEYLL